LNHQPLVDCLQARLLGLQALRYHTGEGPLDELVYTTPEQSQTKAKDRSRVIDALELTVRAARSRFGALGGMWKGLKKRRQKPLFSALSSQVVRFIL
jgi:hypothetical protein